MIPTTTLRLTVIRWGCIRDLPEILAIERDSFASPWAEDDFRQMLRRRSMISMVATQAEQLVGYMVYELHDLHLTLHNFAVASSARRQGIGSLLIDRLKYKLASHRRERILATVGEWNTLAQLFFRACGFRAVAVRREFYPNGHDGYVMEYRP